MVESALARSPVQLVQLAVEMEQLQLINPTYRETTIPFQFYPELKDASDIHTIGAPMVLVASAKLEDETAYQLVSALFEATSQIREIPIFRGFSQSTMVEGLQTALLHPGAQRFFTDKRLLSAKLPLFSQRTGTELIWAPATNTRRALACMLTDEPVELESSAGTTTPAPATTPAAASKPPKPPMLGDGTKFVATLFNRLSVEPGLVALIPTYAIGSSSASTSEPGEKLERDKIRALMRLPGDVLYVVAAKGVTLGSLASLPLGKIGLAQDVPPELRFCLERSLGVKRLTQLTGDAAPSDDELISLYRANQLTALVLVGPIPSTLVRQALAARPGQLLALPPPNPEACRGGMVEPDAIPSSAFSPPLKNGPLPTWTLPEALFTSLETPAASLQPLLERARTRPFEGRSAQLGQPNRTEWSRQELLYPLHPAVSLTQPTPEDLKLRDLQTLTIASAGVRDDSFPAALSVAQSLSRYCMVQSDGSMPCGKRLQAVAETTTGYEEEASSGCSLGGIRLD